MWRIAVEPNPRGAAERDMLIDNRFVTVCDTRAGPNTWGIPAILLISCCFHFWFRLSHPVTASIWWPVQQQEQIALLDWSQRTVAANKLLLRSDPLNCERACCVACVSMWMCICVSVCVRVLVCVTLSDLFPIRKWNPLWGFFFPPSEPFSFITSPALPWATGCAPTLQRTPRQASAASILWTEVLSGYYFSADHIKTTAIKRYWAIRLCLLRGKKREWVSERSEAEKKVGVKARKRETSTDAA